MLYSLPFITPSHYVTSKHKVHSANCTMRLFLLIQQIIKNMYVQCHKTEVNQLNSTNRKHWARAPGSLGPWGRYLLCLVGKPPWWQTLNPVYSE